MTKVYFFIHVQCMLVRLKAGTLLRAVFKDSDFFHSVTLPHGSLPNLAPGRSTGKRASMGDVSEAGQEGSCNTSVRIH